jgi:hypothetical protein
VQILPVLAPEVEGAKLEEIPVSTPRSEGDKKIEDVNHEKYEEIGKCEKLPEIIETGKEECRNSDMKSADSPEIPEKCQEKLDSVPKSDEKSEILDKLDVKPKTVENFLISPSIVETLDSITDNIERFGSPTPETQKSSTKSPEIRSSKLPAFFAVKDLVVDCVPRYLLAEEEDSNSHSPALVIAEEESSPSPPETGKSVEPININNSLRVESKSTSKAGVVLWSPLGLGEGASATTTPPPYPVRAQEGQGPPSPPFPSPPLIPTPTAARKMENLEKVAAGLLASATNYNNNTLIPSTCDPGTSTRTPTPSTITNA